MDHDALQNDFFNYEFQVKDICNGTRDSVHGTRLKFYAEDSPHTPVILSHVLSSETCLPVSRLLHLIEQNGQLFVTGRRKGLSNSEDTNEPLQLVYEAVPQLLIKLLKRKNRDPTLRKNAFIERGLEEEVCNNL